MTAKAWTTALGFALLVGAAAAGPAAEPPPPARLHGACYCQMAEALSCTVDLTEADCHRHCDEALCDDWFWKDRLPCWNWGYGG